MLLLLLPCCLLISQLQMETNLEGMDAYVTRLVGIIFVPIVLFIGTCQEEEEEEQAMLVMIEMVEEEDVVPWWLQINIEPLWQLGNTSTRWIPIPLLKLMVPPGSSAINVCVQ